MCLASSGHVLQASPYMPIQVLVQAHKITIEQGSDMGSLYLGSDACISVVGMPDVYL